MPKPPGAFGKAFNKLKAGEANRILGPTSLMQL
jgi:hypothetical protein